MRTKLSICGAAALTAFLCGSTTAYAAGSAEAGKSVYYNQIATPQKQTIRFQAYIIFDITRTSGVYGIVGAGSPSSWRSFVPICPFNSIPYPGTWNPKTANNGGPLSQSDTTAFNYANYRCMCKTALGQTCSTQSPLWGIKGTAYAWGSPSTGNNITSTVQCLLPIVYEGPPLAGVNLNAGPPVLYYSASGPTVTPTTMYHYDAWVGGSAQTRPVPAKYGYIDPGYAMALDYKACNLSGGAGPNDPSSPMK